MNTDLVTHIVARFLPWPQPFDGCASLLRFRATRATPKLQKKVIRSWLVMDIKTRK